RLRQSAGRGQYPRLVPRIPGLRPPQRGTRRRRRTGAGPQGLRSAVGAGPSEGGRTDQRRARPDRLRGEADRHRPRRHRLGFRRRRRRAARGPAHRGRLPQLHRRPAGTRAFGRGHPQDPRRQPDAGVGGDRGGGGAALRAGAGRGPIAAIAAPAKGTRSPGTTKPRSGGASLRLRSRRWPLAVIVRRDQSLATVFFATTFFAGALATVLAAAFFATGAAAEPLAFAVTWLRAL